METRSNPYKAPESNSELTAEEENFIPAGKGVRFLNYIIDYIMQIGLAIVIVFILMMIGGEQVVTRIPDILLGVMSMLIYYIFMEGMFGRTVGKFVTGTKVVSENGGQPSFGQVVGRSFSRIIPFEAFSFLGSQARGWHDSLPNTFVVKCR